MTNKKVSIGVKPSIRAMTQPAADAWVENRGLATDPEPMKRLTIDIPASLHRAIKTQCSARDAKIADEVRSLLMEKYAKS
jgi:hypothetical protein